MLESYTALFAREDARGEPDRVAMPILGPDWCRDGDDVSCCDGLADIVLSPCDLRPVHDGPRRLSRNGRLLGSCR